MMLIASCLVGALLAGDPASGPGSTAGLLSDYRAAIEKSGPSPAEHVRLALWCEARGLADERLRHLNLAIIADPTNAAARGLMGMVNHRGRWLRPEAVAAETRADAALAEYEARRSKAPYTAEAQWELGTWAAEHGLRDQARAHLTAVIRLDPSRDAAWKKLGYRRHEGRWRTDAQVAAGKTEAAAQERADREYGSSLARWRDDLGDAARRAEARRGLDGVTDPRAVASVVRVLVAGGQGGQDLAVRLLGQIDSPRSSRVLAWLATWGLADPVRRAAAETLARRDPRESIGLLIGGFRRTIRYELGASRNASGALIPYLAIEGKNYDFVLNSTRALAEIPARLFDASVPFDPRGILASQASGFGGPFDDGAAYGMGAGGLAPANGSSGEMTRRAAVAASLRDAEIARFLANGGPELPPRFKAQAEDLMAQIDDYNRSATRANAAIHTSLRMITGRDLPMDPEAWRGWWVDSLGYAFKSGSSRASLKPTFEYTVVSCFAAGTPVRCQGGERPIESLRVGDQVLAQDTATGGLRYRTITGVHHNPPAMVLRVRFGDEVILATGLHRFWKPGSGWIMARDLRTGDPVRTLDGVFGVSSIEPDRVQPVFNLDVADDADFFVGGHGALVHDNSLPDPRLAPFDAAK